MHKEHEPGKATSPIFKMVDCVMLSVPDLEAGLAFYCERLGLQLNWRREDAAGLMMPETDTELVLTTETKPMEVDFLVEDVLEVTQQFLFAGGEVIEPPFEIPVGRVAVVQDPWGNQYILLDLSKGRYQVDESGQVTGVG